MIQQPSGSLASVTSTSVTPTNKGKKAGSVYQSRAPQTLETLCSSNSSEHTSSSDDNSRGHGLQSQRTGRNKKIKCTLGKPGYPISTAQSTQVER